MTESSDKTKRHFIRGIRKKDNVILAPLVQVVKFCRRFPSYTASQIGDMLDNSIKELENNDELLKEVPEVSELKKPDGGVNGRPKKETQEE